MRRVLLTAAALLIPVSAVSIVGISGIASAATGRIECTSISGNASSTVTLSGCTGGDTGGSSESLPAGDLASGGTVDWVSGANTTIAPPALKSVSASKCPGYVKKAASNPAAESFKATITGDQEDAMLIPGTATGEVCVASDGTITLLKTIEFSWKESTLKCSTISGNAASTITISGCTGGDTGGSSEPVDGSALATGGQIDWVSGGNTTISQPTLTPTSATKCPGYVKGGASNPAADKVTATVTGDTGDGLKLSGAVKGAVCIGSDGSVTALSPLEAK
jgi:hypothetical protein